MGVSIHYRGRLDDLDRLGRFREELTDIAAGMGWGTSEFDEDWEAECTGSLVRKSDGLGMVIEGHLPLKGIVLAPSDDTESVYFLFDRAGRLRSLLGMIESGPDHDEFISVKTQFGGWKTHLWLIGLLRYLKRTYLEDLEVSDEGGIWEGGTAEELREKMGMLGELIANIAHDLENSEVPLKALEDFIIRSAKRHSRESEEEGGTDK